MRLAIKKIIKEFIPLASNVAVYRDHADISRTKVQVIELEVFDEKYFWMETLDPSKNIITSCQLEKSLYDISGEIIFPTDSHRDSLTALTIHYIKQGTLKQIE